MNDFDYDHYYSELSKCKLSLNDDPTPKSILTALAKAQEYRTRTLDILIKAIKNRRKCKNIWLVRFDNELKSRNEKSAEQREAAVREKFRIEYECFKQAEDFEHIVELFYQDLVSINNNIVKQAYLLQQEMKTFGETFSINHDTQPESIDPLEKIKSSFK